MVAWDIENYYISGGRVLCVEFVTPLTTFLMVEIDDVKKAWMDMLNEVAVEQPGYDMSWEMVPRNEDAVVIVRIANEGELETFTPEEAKTALEAIDALFEEDEKTSKTKKATRKSKPKKKTK